MSSGKCLERKVHPYFICRNNLIEFSFIYSFAYECLVLHLTLEQQTAGCCYHFIIHSVRYTSITTCPHCFFNKRETFGLAFFRGSHKTIFPLHLLSFPTSTINWFITQHGPNKISVTPCIASVVYKNLNLEFWNIMLRSNGSLLHFVLHAPPVLSSLIWSP